MVWCWVGYWMKVDFPREENWGGNCVFICLFGDVRRNRRQDTLDFMDGNMIGSKIGWHRQLSDLAFQGWLIHQCMHPCSCSNFKPTRQLTVIILISWHQWVTSSHKNIWCSWLVWDWCCSMSKVLFRFSYVYNTPGGHVMCTFSSSQY